MREFYEAFWADAPDDAEPYEWDRRRALLLAAPVAGLRVLDLGCGAGRFLTALREAGADAVGAELAEAAAVRARAATGLEVRLVEPDGTLPFGHGEFDLVWCSEVLEHIPDVLQTLTEVRRVLKRGGRLLLTVPFHSRLRAAAIALTRFESHFDPLGQHVRFFTARSLGATLDAANLPAERVERLGPLLAARARRG